MVDFDPRPAKNREVTPEYINYFLSNLQSLSQNRNGALSMRETQLQFTYKDYNLSCERSILLSQQVTILLNNIKPGALYEMPDTQQQSLSEEWFRERWLRVTASKCHAAFKVGKLVMESLPNAAVEAFKFISHSIWGIDAVHFQTFWMRYGLESELKAIQKYESISNVKVHTSGLWVNPTFPYLGCSPDGLVNDDTVVEIKALKISKEYSVVTVVSPISLVPKQVLKRQCFEVNIHMYL